METALKPPARYVAICTHSSKRSHMHQANRLFNFNPLNFVCGPSVKMPPTKLRSQQQSILFVLVSKSRDFFLKVTKSIANFFLHTWKCKNVHHRKIHMAAFLLVKTRSAYKNWTVFGLWNPRFVLYYKILMKGFVFLVTFLTSVFQFPSLWSRSQLSLWCTRYPRSPENFTKARLSHAYVK